MIRKPFASVGQGFPLATARSTRRSPGARRTSAGGDVIQTSWQNPLSYGKERTVVITRLASTRNRQTFIGGSDARVIMGTDEAALLYLWQEKRGEVEPEDLSGNLIVQLGVATEEVNRTWYERNTGRRIRDVQR